MSGAAPPPLAVAWLRATLQQLSVATRRVLGPDATADELEALSSLLPGPPVAPPLEGEALLGDLAALARAARSWLEPYLGAPLPPFAGLPPTWPLAAAGALDRLETTVGGRLREPLRQRMYGLYVIIDPQVTGGRDPAEVALAALEGGARMVQLRDKARDKGDSLALAQGLRMLCLTHGALFIVNDHVDLAVAAAADGVHLGQHDLPMAQARRLLPLQAVVGTSNATVEEGVASWEEGADYVAVGAMYPTSTKERTRPAGLETLRAVRARVRGPIVAIGGITAANVAPVVEAGADVVCVISAVALAPDPRAAAQELVGRIRAAGGRA